jgi:hypothetical protein
MIRRPKLDEVLGERVTIIHTISGEFLGAENDPSRPAFTATAIMIVEDILAMSASVLAGTAERTDVIISDPSATFMPNQFGPGRPEPREGTRLVRSSWPGNPTFRVLAEPLVDSLGQLVCRLAPIEATTEP